ncbi:MAG: pilW [Herminiimonas sp.]|nr:pilW [Herminiimonas sp.]
MSLHSLFCCAGSVLSRRGSVCVFLLAILGSIAGCATNPADSGSVEPLTASDQTELQRRAQIRLQLAIGYYEQGQMAVALDEVKQALQLDPNFVDALGVRALIYMEMAETRLADESFVRAMKLAPTNPDLINNYGWFLCQNGRERESIAYFETALKSRTYQSPAKALNNAGTCSLKLKDEAAAHRYLMQAFQHEPGNQQTNANLAKLFYARGDYPRARFYISNLMKSDNLTAEALWTALKIERKLGDSAAASGLANQLRRHHPNSKEYAALLRGAFDE